MMLLHIDLLPKTIGIRTKVGKMTRIIQLDYDSLRDAVDVRDRFDLFRDARRNARHSYGGSMKFERRGPAEYLIRRPYGTSTRKSCGRRTPETEEMLEKFLDGKAQTQDRLSALRQQISDRARILRARGLGRVPSLTARIMRKLDDLNWLGTSLTILGTNALFAYEAMAGVRIETGLLATGDVDVLYDVRRRLRLSGEVAGKGLVGALQSVDRSFRKTPNKPYKAANREGYMVDLLEPLDHERIMHKGKARLSDHPDDLVAPTTKSSRWLLNTPKFEATAFDERGLPVRIVTIDPRVFALRKQWIVENDSTRDPVRRTRDEEQARIVAMIATRHLGLSFEDPALSGLPGSFRDLSDRWAEVPPEEELTDWW